MLDKRSFGWFGSDKKYNAPELMNSAGKFRNLSEFLAKRNDFHLYRAALLNDKAIEQIFSSFRVNAVSNAQVRGESYDSGCMGQTGCCMFILIHNVLIQLQIISIPHHQI